MCARGSGASACAESWSCRRTLTTRSRRCCICRRRCRTATRPEFLRKPTERIAPRAGDHARARLLPLHQPRAMRDIYERLLTELPFPLLLQGTAPRNVLLQQFRDTPNAVPLRHVELLAGRGCAGRAAELRHRRPAAVCCAQRSGGEGAHGCDRGRRRQAVLRLPGARRR